MWNQMYKNGSKLPFWLLVLVTMILFVMLYLTRTNNI
jgi:type VI protein secretion system component VasF